jgi:ATP-dependent DNA ligase
MLWTPARPRRAQRTLPDGFCIPCAPTLAPAPPSGPGWLHELKYDGFRMVVRRDGARVRLWSRNMTDWTAAFPGIAASVLALPSDHIVLDGEAVVLRDDGHCDFGAIQSRHERRAARLMAFDLLLLDGRDLRRLPLQDRRAMLVNAIGEAGPYLVPTDAIAGEGATVFDHACRLGVEGIVSKRLGTAYQSGRSRHWLKSKNPEYLRRGSAGGRL